jgi:hypothetical protein
VSNRKKAYQQRYVLDQLRGVSHTPVPAGPVRAHVNTLVAAGASYARIAEAAGLTRQGVRWIVNRQGETVRRSTARALMRVQLADVTGSRAGRVPAVGTHRRLQALLALGHTYATIAAAAGVPNEIRPNWHQGSVLAATHDAVCRAYEVLSMVPGQNAHTRSFSATRGYAPPLAWDDEDLDDPYAQPQGVDGARHSDRGATAA